MVKFGEVRMAQLAKSTLLTSTLVTLGCFKVCSDAKERVGYGKQLFLAQTAFFYFVCFTHSILHIHISNASTRFCSFHLSVQVSVPYILNSFSRSPLKWLRFHPYPCTNSDDHHGQLTGWRRWSDNGWSMSCDVGEATEVFENEQSLILQPLTSLHLCHSSFYNYSVASPTSPGEPPTSTIVP